MGVHGKALSILIFVNDLIIFEFINHLDVKKNIYVKNVFSYRGKKCILFISIGYWKFIEYIVS
jgi:hypothetical protein